MQFLTKDEFIYISSFTDRASLYCLKITSKFHYSRIIIKDYSAVFYDAGLNNYQNIVREMAWWNINTTAGIIAQPKCNASFVQRALKKYPVTKKKELDYLLKTLIEHENIDVLDLLKPNKMNEDQWSYYPETVINSIYMSPSIIEFIIKCFHIKDSEIISNIRRKILKEENYIMINWLSNSVYEEYFIDQHELLVYGTLNTIKYVYEKNLKIIHIHNHLRHHISAAFNGDPSVFKWICEKNDYSTIEFSSHMNIQIMEILEQAVPIWTEDNILSILPCEKYDFFKYMWARGPRCKGRRVINRLIQNDSPLEKIIDIINFTNKKPSKQNVINCIQYGNKKLFKWILKTYNCDSLIPLILKELLEGEIYLDPFGELLKVLIKQYTNYISFTKLQYIRAFSLGYNMDMLYNYIEDINVKSTFDLLPLTINRKEIAWIMSKRKDWIAGQRKNRDDDEIIKFSLYNMDRKCVKLIYQLYGLYENNEKVSRKQMIKRIIKTRKADWEETYNTCVD